MKRVRITFLSGDVHCAAVGVLKTLSRKDGNIPPATDHRYMINVITSAIVNTPCVTSTLMFLPSVLTSERLFHRPPSPVILMVSTLATKTHKTLHHADTDETMVQRLSLCIFALLTTRLPDAALHTRT